MSAAVSPSFLKYITCGVLVFLNQNNIFTRKRSCAAPDLSAALKWKKWQQRLHYMNVEKCSHVTLLLRSQKHPQAQIIRYTRFELVFCSTNTSLVLVINVVSCVSMNRIAQHK